MAEAERTDYHGLDGVDAGHSSMRPERVLQVQPIRPLFNSNVDATLRASSRTTPPIPV